MADDFPVKDWRNRPDTSTPINAVSIEDMETRLSAYTKEQIESLESSVVKTTDVGADDGVVALLAPATSVEGAGIYRNTPEPGYGDSFNVGDVAESFGWSGSPTTTPATTITANVTFPFTNSTVPVADCAQLNANGGSFTLGGKRVIYTGRSTASGAGNATGAYSLPDETGTVASGTALGNTPTGYFALTIYKRFGWDGRPVHGATQAFGVIANYKAPPVDDSAEAGSFVTVMQDPGTPTFVHQTVTGGEMTANLGGNWRMLDGYTAELAGGGVRTAMTATDQVKNAIGLKVVHEAGGFMQQYDGLYQTASALETYGTLNGGVTLPTGTIAVTGTFPPATAANPVTVVIGANGHGVGGQQVTYTGQSAGNLTGCTGGTGTLASGASITNDVRSINVRDRVVSAAGFFAGASGWSGSIAAATKGNTDAIQSMLNIQGPTNAEVTGGLTQVALRAGSGQTKSILQAFDTSGTQRLAISKDGALITTGQQVIANTSGGTSTVKLDGTKGLQVGNLSQGLASTPWIMGCTGVPTMAGALGDIMLRADGGVGSTIYRCTTAGGAGVAVWTAIL